MTKKTRLHLETMADLLTQPAKPIDWLIENIWVDKARGFIAGVPGIGKTWLALDMLLAVSSGQLCLGKYPAKKANVLLVEEEASVMNLQRRIHSMARGRGLKDADLTSFFHITRQGSNILRDVAELGVYILENDIRFVVFDSLRAVHQSDENSSTEMQKVLDAFGRLNLCGCAVLLIHHLKKSDDKSKRQIFENMRGSTALWAWRDCIIGMEGEEESEHAHCTFQFRDAESPAPITVKRIQDELSGAITLAAEGIEESEEFTEKAEFILSYLKTQFGGKSKSAIAKYVGGNKQSCLRTINVMIKRKFLVKNGTGWTVPENTGTTQNHGT